MKGATTTRTFFLAGLVVALAEVGAFVPPTATSLRNHAHAPSLYNPLPDKESLQPNPFAERLGPRKQSISSLAAIPPSVVSAVGHVLGGNLATPFVIDAVKTWYARIPLPTWCPPNGIFGPVWVVLYSMIGVAASRVAAIKGWKSPTMLLWVAHYALNLIWAPLFFGMAKLRAAAVVNAVMTLSMAPIIYFYNAVDPTAALLVLPYTAWITFATFLNVAICKLNPMDGKGFSEAKLQAGIAKLQKDAAKKVGL